MYRIMLYCEVFYTEQYTKWVFRDPDDLSKVQHARRNFLARFSTDELLQIYSTSLFLVELIGWTGAARNLTRISDCSYEFHLET